MERAQQRKIIGCLYWANTTRFIHPGLYFGTKRIIPIPRMKGPVQPVEFAEQTDIIAKNQPEYLPLPAYIDSTGREGRVTFCWQFSLADRLKILFRGNVWQSVWTFRQSLQPQMIGADKPKMP